MSRTAVRVCATLIAIGCVIIADALMTPGSQVVQAFVGGLVAGFPLGMVLAHLDEQRNRCRVEHPPVGASVRVTWTNPPDSDHPRRSCPYPDGCTGCVDTIDGTVLEVDDDSVTVAATEGTEVYTLGETFTVYAVELADGRATLEVL